MSSPTSDSHDLTISKPPPTTAVLLAQKLPKPYINSLCGAAAGVASGIVTCPLDVIKTKLQAQGSFRHQQLSQGTPATKQVYRGLVGTAKTIVRQDGLKGMYRGLGPMILGYLPTWAVYMSIYDIAKTNYSERVEPQWLAHVCSSVTAGACSTLATNPIWVIKTRLMSQISTKAVEGHRTPWHYNNTWDAARQMYKGEGIKAFYSGLAPALLGLTHVAIQFPLYEYLKLRFTGVEMGAAPPSQGTNSVGVLAATCISKICATTATYPHEVLRTRLQTQQRGIPSSDGMINKPRYQGVLKTCRLILYEEGWTAFYSGMGTNLIRAVPAAMTTMLTFETLKSLIVRMQTDNEEEHARPI
ncbi:hypothetical protein E4T39_04158 [Aureobasidium subglaciale]|nr:hypothetical protein E4T39_04158 [Aureobasidium subglaciale]